MRAPGGSRADVVKFADSVTTAFVFLASSDFAVDGARFVSSVLAELSRFHVPTPAH
jgi:hypothetical protein